jgi:hypothetical protein
LIVKFWREYGMKMKWRESGDFAVSGTEAGYEAHDIVAFEDFLCVSGSK